MCENGSSIALRMEEEIDNLKGISELNLENCEKAFKLLSNTITESMENFEQLAKAVRNIDKINQEHLNSITESAVELFNKATKKDG